MRDLFTELGLVNANYDDIVQQYQQRQKVNVDPGGPKPPVAGLAAPMPQAPAPGGGIMDALRGGFQSTWRMLGATVDAYQDDEQEILDTIRTPIEQTYDQRLFRDAIERRKADDPEGAGLWEGIKNVGGAIGERPLGALHEVAAQLPNSLAVLGSAGAGALAGSALGPLGTIAGGIAGMAAGNIGLETGGIALDQAQRGKLDLPLARQQGAIKGGVITAVDTATIGINRALMGAPGKAVGRMLAARGVDPTNAQAIRVAFQQNPGLRDEAIAAFSAAVPKGAERYARLGAGFGLETAGEGVGEYFGSKAAGLEADITDAVLESMLSIPQSAIETGAAAYLGRGNRDVQRFADSLPAQPDPALPPPGAIPPGDAGQGGVAPGTGPGAPSPLQQLADRLRGKTETMNREMGFRAAERQQGPAPSVAGGFDQAEQAAAAQREAELDQMAQQADSPLQSFIDHLAGRAGAPVNRPDDTGPAGGAPTTEPKSAPLGDARPVNPAMGDAMRAAAKKNPPNEIRPKSGNPFKSEASALNNAKMRKLEGYAPVQVDGGWVLRRQEGAPAPKDDAILLSPRQDQQPGPIFRTRLEQLIEERVGKGANGAALSRQIDAWQRKGEIKPEELQYVPIQKFLAENPGRVSKQQLLDFVGQNKPQLGEVVRSGVSGYTDAEREAYIENQISQYDVTWDDDEGGYVAIDPNGEIVYDFGGDVMTGRNEDNVLSQLVEVIGSQFDGMSDSEVADAMGRDPGEPTKYDQYKQPGGENYKELLITRDDVVEGPDYTSSHWDEDNVLAHVRFDERRGANGEKVLFLEEIQSDWHQEGRKKGYADTQKVRGYEPRQAPDGRWELFNIETGEPDPSGQTFATRGEAAGIAQGLNDAVRQMDPPKPPDAPFKKTWPMLAMKRMIRYAADNGFDRIAWATGEQNANLYTNTMRRQVEWIFGSKLEDGSWNLLIEPKEGSTIHRTAGSDEQLAEMIGKDNADDLIKQGGGELKGDNLKIGGEGMIGFYDQILPAEVNKYAKRYGVKVEMAPVGESYEAFLKKRGLEERNGRIFHSASGSELNRSQVVSDYRSDNPAGPFDAHSFPVTDQMHDDVLAGQPMFNPKQDAAAEKKKPAASQRPQRAEPGAAPITDVAEQQRVSTRRPNAVNSPENPITEMLSSRYAAFRRVPDLVRKAALAVAKYPQVRLGRATKPESILDKAIEQFRDNLLWLYSKVDPDLRERSKRWYDGANRIANRMAARYGVTTRQAAGVLATQSPQKDWFENVSLGERIIDIWQNYQDHTWDSRMDKVLDRVVGAEALAEIIGEDVVEGTRAEIIHKLAIKKRANSKKEMTLAEARAAVEKTLEKKQAAAKALINAVRGKRLSDVWDDEHRAVWIRVFDAAHNSPHYHVVSPEGDFVGIRKGKTGRPASIRWGNFAAIAKSVSVLRDGSFENISDQLGEMHKIRNFYNNIIDPNAPEQDVTIDTHAIAADMLSPFSSMSTPVSHNFGSTGKSSVYGLSGTYPMHLEAYQQAADQAGVLGREMQSITWEAVRGLFTAPFKSRQSNVAAVNAIWERYQAGEVSQDQARNQILAYVMQATGRTEAEIFTPEWAGSPLKSQSETSFKQIARVRPAPRQPRSSTGINAEVAPNPDSLKRGGALLQMWAELPEAEQAKVTRNVAGPVIKAMMRKLGIKAYDVEYTLGGFEGETNPSVIVSLGPEVGYEAKLEAAKVLGVLWRQKAMITYDETDTAGGAQTHFVKVTPDRNLSYNETRALFVEVNKRYPAAAGVTARDGSLVFGNFEGLPEQEFRDGITAALADIDVDYGFDANSTRFRSDWIEPVNLEGTRYGESNMAGDAPRRGVSRWERDFGSIQSDSDARFKREVRWAHKRSRAGSGDAGVQGAARPKLSSRQDGSRAPEADRGDQQGRARREGRADREQSLLTGGIGGDGRNFTDFFAKVSSGVLGKPKPGVTYQPIIPDTDGRTADFTAEYVRHRGHFDDHIKFSIPGFGELQRLVGSALARIYGPEHTLLDIGASEGAFMKAVTRLSGMRSVAVDPNPSMVEHFNKTPVPGAEYRSEAFGTADQAGELAWTEDDGTEIRYFDPAGQRYDVIHEAMVFQFISNDRTTQIARVKELMTDDGVAIFEEKLLVPGEAWKQNEAQKNAHKLQYFDKESLDKKAVEVLEGMNKNMVPPAQLEEILSENFAHVAQFWDSGNFKGYIASDSRENLDRLLDEIGSTQSDYATTETPRNVSDGPSLSPRQTGEQANTQNQEATDGEPTAEQKVSRLNRDVGFPPGVLKQVTVRNPQLARLFEALGRVLDRDIVPIWNAHPNPDFKFNGVYNPRDPRTLFIDVDANSPALAVLGHEFIHSLRRLRSDDFRRLANEILRAAGLTNRDVERYADWVNARRGSLPPLPAEGIMEEMVADIFGEAINDRGFWQRLEKRDAGLAKQLAKALKDFVDWLISGLKGAPQLEGSKYVRDMESVRDIAAEFLGDYAGDAGVFDGVGADPLLSGRQGQTQTEAFKRWFGDSKVVDETGEPLVVYHGSMSDFSAFDRTFSNPGSDMGGGFYFSNNPNDVGSNYAGEGPDAKSKIENLAERVAMDMGIDADDPVVMQEVRSQLAIDNQGVSYPVYLKIENPVVIENDGFGTFIESGIDFDWEQFEDDAREELGPEADNDDVQDLARDMAAENGYESITGGVMGMLEHIESMDVYDADIDQLREDISYFTFEGGSAQALVDAMKSSKGLMYASDPDTGARISSEVIRDAFEAIGYDGIIDRTVDFKFGSQRQRGQSMIGMDPDTTHYIAFRPEQIKSAVGNSGAFDSTNPDILFMPTQNQTSGGAQTPPAPGPTIQPPTVPTFNAPDEISFLDQVRTKLYEKFTTLLNVQRAIGPVSEDKDVQLALTTYPGRVRARLNDFERDYVEPLKKAITESKLSFDEIGKYLHARHAPSANRRLKARNPNRPNNDRLSGMSDAEARAIVNQYQGNLAMQRIVKMLDDIRDLRMDVLVNEGLLTRAEANAWNNAWQHYVPLNREETKSTLPKRGQGYDVRGKESKVRAGSADRPVDHENMVARILTQYEFAVARAEKNQVAQTLYRLAKDNPNDAFWIADQVPSDPFLKASGQVGWRDNYISRNVMAAKFNGETKYLTFNDQNAHAAKAVEALKNLDANSAKLLGPLLFANRVLAALNTSLSPEFVISNFFRDWQTAGYNLTDTELKDMKAKVLKGTPAAIKGIRNALRGDNSTAMAAMFDRFSKAGGITGWMQSYDQVGDRLKALQWDMKSDRIQGLKQLKAIFKAIEDYNTVIENGVRLSAFKTAVEAGMSDAKAARLAKELTVNFNRRGEWGVTMNALYLFYNASIQGSIRMLRAIVRKDNRMLHKMLGATVAFAVATEIMNHLIDGDDDEYENVPDQVKDRNLVLMDPFGIADAGYFKIPLPWGYNLFHILGQEIGKAAMAAAGERPDYSPFSSAARLLTQSAQAFNPIQDGSVIQTLAPTLVDPAVRIAENKDWHGGRLYPDYNDKQANYLKAFATARETSKDISKWLYEATLDPETMSATVDVSPEWLDMIFDFATGSAGRVLADSVGFVKSVVSGNGAPELKEIPLARKVYQSVSDSDRQRAFYEKYQEMLRIRQALSDAGDFTEKREILDRLGERRKLIGLTRITQSQLNQISRALKVAKRAGDKERIEQLEKRRMAVMERFGKRYYKVIYGED